MADINVLREPFAQLHQREGAGGKSFSYVPGGDVLDRILTATDGVYDWEIIDIRLVDGQAKANKRTGEVYTTPACWMVHGRLTIPGLGSKDGVGTATAESEESPKSAETDAMKRAAVKFGVALQLYRKDEQQASSNSSSSKRPPVAGQPPLNESGSKCPYCQAPSGKMHLRSCPSLQQAAA